MPDLEKPGTRVLVAFVVALGIIAYSVYADVASKKQGAQMVFSDARGFWRGEVRPSDDGYLITDKLIPLRAIARRPTVPMYANLEQGSTESFREVMRTWTPYYVYRYDAAHGALLVGETARMSEEDALWVLEADVYCWTTREVLTIEQSMPIFESLEDAKAERNPIRVDYAFPYREPSTNTNPQQRLPRMVGLPVLRREEGIFWSFIRPDPEAVADYDPPYQVNWVRWAGEEGAATVRLRITRPEFEEYTLGLQALLYDWKWGSSADKAEAHRGMLQQSQSAITNEEVGGRRLGIDVLATKTLGIPHPSGILVRPIMDELQAENVENRLGQVLVMGNDRSLWDRFEIAYIEVDRMP